MASVTYDRSKGMQDRMLSIPTPVHAAGWTSDTLTLQRHGWDFYVMYNAHMMSYDMALINRQGNGQAVSFHNRIPDYRNILQERAAPIIIDHMAPKLCLETIYQRQSHWRGRKMMAVNMEPTSLRAFEESSKISMVESRTKNVFGDINYPLELICWRPDDRQFEAKAPDMVIREQDTDELLSLLKSRFEDSDEEYFEAANAGLITDQKTIQRHLHLVSVR